MNFVDKLLETMKGGRGFCEGCQKSHSNVAYHRSVCPKENTRLNKKLFIVEGSGGHWHYHLATREGDKNITLCKNERIMSTGLSIDTWGMKSSHINESYCKECEDIAKELGLM